MQLKRQVDCKAKSGFTTVRVRTSTLKKLWLYKRILGIDSLDKMLVELMEHPDMLSWLADRHKETAYSLQNLNLNPRAFELSKNQVLIKNE